MFAQRTYVSLTQPEWFLVISKLQVKTIRPWTMSGRVASSYQKGRVFLVGDAAHHFPPSGAAAGREGVGIGLLGAWTGFAGDEVPMQWLEGGVCVVRRH